LKLVFGALVRVRATLSFAFLASAVSCGAFDSDILWRGGPYALMWIDLPDMPFVARDEGKGSWTPRVDEQVFAVGWDGRYLVAKSTS
jgi:hypothetical protein